MVTIIGIGQKAGQLTESALKEISSTRCAIIRTGKTLAGKAAANFAKKNRETNVLFLDELFEKADSFDELNAMTVECVREKEKEFKNVCYLVDGDGREDNTSALLISRGACLIEGVSAFGGQGSKFSATDLVAKKPVINTSENLIVYSVDSKLLAGELKLFLMDNFSEDKEITILYRGEKNVCSLFQLDHFSDFDYSTTIILKAERQFSKKRYCFNDLIQIMQRLTAPNGCEWDKAQNHESIAVNLIEESYEAVDAIFSKDIDNMAEEIGDVLLQAVFHADIGFRCGEFTLNDIISGLCDKLVTRHTHIFGEDKAANSAEALVFWEKAKAKEKNYESITHQMNLVPDNFPSILKAQKYIKKAVKAGESSLVDGDEIKKDILTAERDKDVAKLLFNAVRLCVKENKNGETELLLAAREFKEKFSKDND